MNTCGTCKYRGVDEDVPEDFFLCRRVRHWNGNGPHAKPSEKAVVEDGSGYYAALCVTTDFGCVLWEAA